MKQYKIYQHSGQYGIAFKALVPLLQHYKRKTEEKINKMT